MALNLPHRHYVPPSNGQRLPAVVMVHGRQGNENVMSIFERTLPEGVVMASPRAPVTEKPDSHSWFRLDAPETFEPGLAALEAFVRGLPETYPVDPARVVLIGFSQGAAMSYALLLKEPSLAVGVAGLAGFLPRQAQPWAHGGRLAGKRIFMAHGTEDDTVPVKWAREAAEVLRGTGAVIEIHEYPVAHKLNAQGMKDLKAWMKTVMDEAAHTGS